MPINYHYLFDTIIYIYNHVTLPTVVPIELFAHATVCVSKQLVQAQNNAIELGFLLLQYPW